VKEIRDDHTLNVVNEYFNSSAGILEQSMGARNREGIGLSYRLARLHRLAGRYNISVPTRFLAPIDCSKMPGLVYSSLQRTNTENWKKIFKEKELRGHSPNFHIHVSVSDLYIPTQSICYSQEICGPILGMYKSLADT
jgi:hypothetical protein